MSKKAIFGFLAAGVFLTTVSLFAPPLLPRPHLTVEPATHDGPCPVTLKFEADILPPPLPGPVKYRFVRSDGGRGPIQELKFLTPRKKKVSTTWTLSRDYEGWVQLRILSPGNVESNRAHFKVRCRTSAAVERGSAAAEESGAPQRFFLDFSDAYLVYSPDSDSIQIVTEGMALSYGGGWEKCSLKPYLYHLRRSDWDNFFWQVNTSRREVIRIRGGEFCAISEGTDRKKLDITVDVVGGEGSGRPDRFFLRFSDSYLVYLPAGDEMQIVGRGHVLSRGEDWDRCRIYPYLYNFRLKTWKGFHWKVNTSRKQAWKTTGGSFCRIGGSDEELRMGVRVVD
ncbi:MAG: hypothetical protein JW747_08285 [Candidatus Aminicenantes bacterium]|nr:hypothetical protein [Candidatus Aminicenantes bacterium]